MLKDRKGFTLLELLIVVAIIAILALVVFVMLDPLKRFQDSRDSVRWQDTTALVDAIHLHQVDNGGAFLNAISSSTIDVGSWYMIVDGGGSSAMSLGCDDTYDSGHCDAVIDNDFDCVDLDQLVNTGYLSGVPISPAGTITWDSGKNDGNKGTGYALRHNANGSVSVQACESENAGTIMVTK